MLSLQHQCLSTSHWIHLYTTLMTCSFYFIVIFRIVFRRKDVSLYKLSGMVTHVCYLYDIDFFSYYSSSFYFIVKGKPISKLWKRNQSPHGAPMQQILGYLVRCLWERYFGHGRNLWYEHGGACQYTDRLLPLPCFFASALAERGFYKKLPTTGSASPDAFSPQLFLPFPSPHDD